MAKNTQTTSSSERDISVDLNAADDSKAVTRTAPSDIAREVRDNAGDGKSPAERELFKRMGRLERNLNRQFDQKLAEREALHQRELSELRESVSRTQTERGGDDAADAAHDAAIQVLKDKLAAAYEKGDSAASAEITLQISKLDAQFWAKKAQAAGVVQRDVKPQPAQAAPPTPKTNGPTAAGSRFINANDEWWDDDAYKIEQGAANTIYLKLVNEEGYDPKSDETFREVAKQLKGKFPTLSVKPGKRDPGDDDEGAGADDNRNDTRQGNRNAASQRMDDRGGQGTVHRSSTSRTLSKEEIATMKACRLDPDDDKDVLQFLREAIALDAAS